MTGFAKPTYPRSFYRALHGIALIPFILSPCVSIGQEAEESEEVFELSPYEVETSKDVGYLSENSLAGTRLNTSLKDTAASISVYNQEFLDDLAATDAVEAMKYSANYEDSLGATDSSAGESNDMLEFPHNFRLRGLNASRARNFFAWDFRIDNYNTERLDEARGPNSVLFGLGSPGGIINTTTKQAKLYGNFGALELQIGEYDMIRGNIDINRVLVEDKLALRVNYLESDENGWRRFSYMDKSAIAIASTFRPAKWITIKLEYENGETNDNRPRNETGYDEFTTWRNAGEVVRDTSGLTDPGNNPDRATLAGFTDRDLGIWWNGGSRATVLPNGKIIDFRSYLITDTQGDLSGAFVQEPGFNTPTMNLTGPYAVREESFETYTGIINLNPAKDLFFELAYNHLEADFFNMDPLAASLAILGNPNSHYLTLDGTEVSDYGGMYFTESRWTERGRNQDIDQFRISGTYEFELGEKLGRHQLAVLYENYEEDHKRRELRQFLDTPVYSNNPTSAGNTIFYQKYFNPGEYDEMYAAPWIDDLEVTINGVTYGTTWQSVGPNNSFYDIYEQESYMGVLQSYWFKDRIVTTLGYREDERIDRQGGFVVNDLGFQEPSSDPALRTKTVYKPTTRTFGIVGHISNWMSVLYNQSSSITLQNTNLRVLPDSGTPLPSDNDGLDVGFNFEFYEGKVNLRAVYYESDAKGEANFSRGARVAGGGVDQALEILADNGYITFEEFSARENDLGAHYYDSESEGYEVSMTTNLTSNWTLRANFSINETTRTNIMPLITPFVDQAIAEVAAIAPGDDGDDSVYSELDFADVDGNPISSNRDNLYEIFFKSDGVIDNVNFEKGFEGKEAYGNRKYRFNLFTRYDFRDGPLDGFYIGAGYRYQSGRVTYVNTDGELLRGPEISLVDLLIGYRVRWTRNVDAYFQINVSNLFDDNTLQVLRRNDTQIVRGYYEEPRYIKFTTRLRF